MAGLKHGHPRWKHLSRILIDCFAPAVIPSEVEGSWLDRNIGMLGGNIPSSATFSRPGSSSSSSPSATAASSTTT